MTDLDPYEVMQRHSGRHRCGASGHLRRFGTLATPGCETYRLAEALAELSNAICWDTTCLNCARLLDASYAETARAEKAEAELAAATEREQRVRALTGGPFSDGYRPYALELNGEVVLVVELDVLRAALGNPEDVHG